MSSVERSARDGYEGVTPRVSGDITPHKRFGTLGTQRDGTNKSAQKSRYNKSAKASSNN
jgi:hypothetical protein